MNGFVFLPGSSRWINLSFVYSIVDAGEEGMLVHFAPTPGESLVLEGVDADEVRNVLQRDRKTKR